MLRCTKGRGGRNSIAAGGGTKRGAKPRAHPLSQKTRMPSHAEEELGAPGDRTHGRVRKHRHIGPLPTRSWPHLHWCQSRHVPPLLGGRVRSRRGATSQVQHATSGGNHPLPCTPSGRTHRTARARAGGAASQLRCTPCAHAAKFCAMRPDQGDRRAGQHCPPKARKNCALHPQKPPRRTAHSKQQRPP